MGRVFTDAAEQEKASPPRVLDLSYDKVTPSESCISLGFCVGLTVKGKKIRAFNLIDEYTRQMSLHLRR